MNANFVVGSLLPFGFHRFDDQSVVAVSAAGDHTFLTQQELSALVQAPEKLELKGSSHLRV
jgi:hypothetical protein